MGLGFLRDGRGQMRRIALGVLAGVTVIASFVAGTGAAYAADRVHIVAPGENCDGMIVDARTHLDLFDLDDLLVLAGFGSFFLFLVFELAEIEDLADGRLGIR